MVPTFCRPCVSSHLRIVLQAYRRSRPRIVVLEMPVANNSHSDRVYSLQRPTSLRSGASVVGETTVTTKKKCFYCERRKWAFRHAYCYTAYAGVAAKAARKIKQPSCEALAIELGQRVGLWLGTLNHFDSQQYDFVVPIPQHWFRRVTVRYNQAEVLAENVARELKLPVRRSWLYRTRLTDKQGTKTIVERRTSVTDSFGCKLASELKSSKILIVDDIVTSGATAHEAAAALRKSGAAKVDIAAFARGVGDFNRK